MSRGKPAASIPMTSRQFSLLTDYSQKRVIPIRESFRLQILLLASQGKNNMEIGRLLKTRTNTVKVWRSRWEESYEQLLIFEAGIKQEGVSDRELLQRLLEVVQDRPRSGAPKRISLEQENQIIAIACKKPEDYGIIMNKWTHEQLANVVISEGVVDSISANYIGVILKKKN